MKKDYRGLYAALVTPYQENGAVDYDELQRLVEHLTRQGMDGFYVGGSTAETFLLTEEERKAVLEAVLEANQRRKTVICHVGSIATDQAIRFARHAQARGADAVSAISPFYYPFSNREIIRYYQDIMNATALDMFVYDFPANSRFSLSEEVLDELKENPRLRGVKFTNSDMFLLERIKTGNPGLALLAGFDEMLLASLSMGADGGVGSTYNCMPGLIRGIHDSFRGGDMQTARAYQQKANDVIKVICKYGVFASVKTLLSFAGFSNHGCRAPFSPMSAEGRRALEAAYRKYIAE